MAMEICLRIEDDGSMSVSQEEAQQEAAEAEGQEEQGTPVKSIDEALQMIKQMADQGSMAPPSGDTEMPESTPDMEGTQEPGGDSAEEEQAMMDNYKPKGR